MDEKDYFILDIETVPQDIDNHFKLTNEEQLKKINPIDSKIIAIGIRYNSEDKIFLSEDEEDILKSFWSFWHNIRKTNPRLVAVGFNVANFDIPFIVARSFINNVKITPFTLKEIVDVKDKINAYRYGPTRGKLKEFGDMLGIKTLDIDGSNIAQIYLDQNYYKIKQYLSKDLEITEKLFIRAIETRIVEIKRW